MRFSYDKGQGWDLGRFFSIHFGSGSGYMREWWCNLNKGPGLSQEKGKCGHTFPYHCNSRYCNQVWCKQSGILRPFYWLFIAGHSLRIWVGPTYWSWHNAKMNLFTLKTYRRVDKWNNDIYKVISFR